MQAAALLEAAGGSWRAVSRDTEARLVLGQAMSDEAKIIGLTNVR